MRSRSATSTGEHRSIPDAYLAFARLHWERQVETLHMFPPGTRVRIRASRPIGSTAKLNGLLATVIWKHPIATGWLIVELDGNPVTKHQRWPVPAQCVERVDDALRVRLVIGVWKAPR
ncbi:MAG: hypothetical protein JO061_12000 [Acidobacteriaceae bacterium]|nr:hypothetical protein [Acidobacteriaceae bacterium]